MFGMVADTATNLSLGVEGPGGHLFIDAWIVFIREITASMVAPREASLKTCTYIYNYKKCKYSKNQSRGEGSLICIDCKYLKMIVV